MRITYHVLNKNRERGELEQRREDVRGDPAKTNELYSKHRLFEQISCVLQQLIITLETKCFLMLRKLNEQQPRYGFEENSSISNGEENMDANDKC